MKFSAVIFDMDGTLLDTIGDLADSVNSVLKRNGFALHTVEEYKYFVGDGAKMLLYRALPEKERDEEKVAFYLAQFQQEYGRRQSIKTKPYEGIEDMLKGLTDAGARLFVLSNKPHIFTQSMAKKYFGERFELVYGAREGVPRKPNPSAALEISKASGISPSEFIYIGDSGVDMQTAVAAGMYPVGALWGFRTKEELLKNGAKKVISSPMELINIYKGTSL